MQSDDATIFLLEEVLEGWNAAKFETREENATNPAPDSIRTEADAADLFLEEFERNTAEVKVLEAEAEAREAKAQERLQQAEIRLQQEMSLRSEVEQKSKDIEEELLQGSEIDENRLETAIKKFEAEAKAMEELAMKAVLEQARLEAVSKTSGDTAQIEVERDARLAAEQAKAEAEARACESEVRADQAEAWARQTEERCRLEVEEVIARAQAALLFSEETQKKASEVEGRFREIEVRAWEADERFRQAVTRLQQEAARRRLAEERANKIELEFNHSLELAGAEFETEIAKVKAEAQSSEAKAKQANEKNKVEITKVKAEVEARVQETEVKAMQVEESYKAEIQAVRAELAATAAAASQSEESQRAEIAKVRAEAEAHAHQLIEAEATCLEMEARARRAETRWRQVYLISKLSFAFVEQIFGETLNMSDEKSGLVFPPDFETNGYLTKFCSDLGGSDTNGSMNHGDFSLPDELKALFEGVAGARVFDEEGAGNDHDHERFLVPVKDLKAAT